jgi:MFS family permease
MLGTASRPGPRQAVLLRRSKAVAGPTWRQLRDGVLAVPARSGVVLLASANFVMVGVMAVVPVHLMAHGQHLEMVGTVISLHVAGMFLPAPVSGWLADRIGPLAVAGIGCLFVLMAGVGGALADPDSAGSAAFVLAILGVGWNFAVVAGSTLIARSVKAALRVYVEGMGEVAMGVSAAAAAPVAGVIVVLGGFSALSLVVALVGLTVAACLIPRGSRDRQAWRAGALPERRPATAVRVLPYDGAGSATSR